MEAFPIGASGPLVIKPVVRHPKCAVAVVPIPNRWAAARNVLVVKIKQESVDCLHAALKEAGRNSLVGQSNVQRHVAGEYLSVQGAAPTLPPQGLGASVRAHLTRRSPVTISLVKSQEWMAGGQIGTVGVLVQRNVVQWVCSNVSEHAPTPVPPMVEGDAVVLAVRRNHAEA